MSDTSSDGAGRHTLSAFDRDLSDLRAMIVEMGGLAEVALDSAKTALTQQNSELASQVVVADSKIDELEAKVGRQIISLIARRAPMADDLREVLAAHKIAGIVERVGDYAKTISKRILQLKNEHEIGPIYMVLELFGGVREMLTQSLDAFAARDREAARAVCQGDREIDELYNRVFLALLAQMMNEPSQITSTTHLMFIAKSLERTGDQATNIAELVYFASSGEELPDRHTTL